MAHPGDESGLGAKHHPPERAYPGERKDTAQSQRAHPTDYQ